ncbi:hypothetical protein GF343_03085 [Candidatus Woesearchaeota archaeon]|nr:hypothetical protein [Candidatus Woesearchaeota archaeon]
MAEDKDLTMRIYVKKEKKQIEKFIELLIKYCQKRPDAKIPGDYPKLVKEKKQIINKIAKQFEEKDKERNPIQTHFFLNYKGIDSGVDFGNYKDFWCFDFTINYGYENLKNKKKYFEFFKSAIKQIKPFAISVGWFLFEAPQDSFSLYPEFEIESRDRKAEYLALYKNPDKRCQQLVFNDMNYFSKELLSKADNKEFFESQEQIIKMPFEEGVISIDKKGFFEEITANEYKYNNRNMYPDFEVWIRGMQIIFELKVESKIDEKQIAQIESKIAGTPPFTIAFTEIKKSRECRIIADTSGEVIKFETITKDLTGNYITISFDTADIQDDESRGKIKRMVQQVIDELKVKSLNIIEEPNYLLCENLSPDEFKQKTLGELLNVGSPDSTAT